MPLRVPLDDLAVLLECAGVGDVSEKPLAGGLRGIHYIQPDGTYAIRYLEGQWEGSSKVHTVLHETAEISPRAGVGPAPWTAKPNRVICPEADRFAAAVMMPPGGLLAAYAQASGFDVVALQNQFQLLLRLRRPSLVGGHAPPAPAAGSVRKGKSVPWRSGPPRGQDDPAHWPSAGRDLGEAGRPAGHGDEADGGHGDTPVPAAQRVAGWRATPQGQETCPPVPWRSGPPAAAVPEYDEGDGIAVLRRANAWPVPPERPGRDGCPRWHAGVAEGRPSER